MNKSNRARARADAARRCVIAVAHLGMAGIAGLSPVAAQSPLPPVDTFREAGIEVSVSQVQQMSIVIKTSAGIIYTDPTGGSDRYAGYPPPDVILVSHEHHEHYDAATLTELATPATRIVVPPYVMAELPEHLSANAVQLANGESTFLGDIRIDAIGAYGVNGEAAAWHPEGRGNGYVVTVDGLRHYIAGSTEATPEVLALEDIYLAFLPLYPPYALSPADALRVVQAVGPEVTYVYQYNSVRTRDSFVEMMEGAGLSDALIAHNIR